MTGTNLCTMYQLSIVASCYGYGIIIFLLVGILWRIKHIEYSIHFHKICMFCMLVWLHNFCDCTIYDVLLTYYDVSVTFILDHPVHSRTLTACVMCLSGLGDPLGGVLLDPTAGLLELCDFKGRGSDQWSLSTAPPVAPCGSGSGPVLSHLSGVGPIWRQSTLAK